MLWHSQMQIICYLDLRMMNPLGQKINQNNSLNQGNQGSSKESNKMQSFEKAPYLEAVEIRGKECSQLLVKPYKTNTLQKDKQGEWIHLWIKRYIRSSDLLSPPEFCKTHPLVVNLFPLKIKQLSSAAKVNYFLKNCQKLANNPMILDLERSHESFFCCQDN